MGHREARQVPEVECNDKTGGREGQEGLTALAMHLRQVDLDIASSTDQSGDAETCFRQALA